MLTHNDRHSITYSSAWKEISFDIGCKAQSEFQNITNLFLPSVLESRIYRLYVENVSKPTPSPVRHNFFQEKQKLHRGLCSEASGTTARAAGGDVSVGGRAGSRGIGSVCHRVLLCLADCTWFALCP